MQHRAPTLALVGILINSLRYNSMYLPFTWVSLEPPVVAAGWLRQTKTSASGSTKAAAAAE